MQGDFCLNTISNYVYFFVLNSCFSNIDCGMWES